MRTDILDNATFLPSTTSASTANFMTTGTMYYPQGLNSSTTWTICCCSCHARQETIEDLVSRLREKLHQEKRVKGEARALIDDLKTFLRD